jgi:dihydroxyacetone kinase
MGVALGACTVPAAGRPGFEIGPGEIELGLGIHGEPGVERLPHTMANDLVRRLLDSIMSDLGLRSGERVALLVNGLGGTPPMELAIVAREALSKLRADGLSVERAWSGNFLTALEMPGISLSLLRLDSERLALLDAPAMAPAWPGPGRIEKDRQVLATPTDMAQAPRGAATAPDLQGPLLAIATALEHAESELTRLDSETGDGDLGISMVRAAEALRSVAQDGGDDPSVLLATLAARLRRAVGGSSGPFYATALLRAARRLPASPQRGDWAQAFHDAVVTVSDLGGAKPGDRTMVDALVPAATALARLQDEAVTVSEIVSAAADAAESAAASTANMLPLLGRSSYLGERVLGVPDPGAVAVAIWLRGLARYFAGSTS